MDRAKLDDIKAVKEARKGKLKGKDTAKLTRKELDEITITLAKMFNLI